jgi:hypothetical protein
MFNISVLSAISLAGLFSISYSSQIQNVGDSLLPTVTPEKGFLGFSSIRVPFSPCKTVSGVISPSPSGSICGAYGSSLSAAGAGTLVGYDTRSPYVASLDACSAQC